MLTIRHIRPRIISVARPPTADEVAAVLASARSTLEAESPLWPLRNAMRAIVEGAIASGSASNAQVDRVGSAYADVEGWFDKWQVYPATVLRGIIHSRISFPRLDLANDPLLSGLQTALLALPQWEDELPN